MLKVEFGLYIRASLKPCKNSTSFEVYRRGYPAKELNSPIMSRHGKGWLDWKKHSSRWNTGADPGTSLWVCFVFFCLTDSVCIDPDMSVCVHISIRVGWETGRGIDVRWPWGAKHNNTWFALVFLKTLFCLSFHCAFWNVAALWEVFSIVFFVLAFCGSEHTS